MALFYNDDFLDMMDNMFRELGLNDEPSVKEENKKLCDKEKCCKKEKVNKAFDFKNNLYCEHFDNDSYRLDFRVTGYPAVDVTINPSKKTLTIKGDTKNKDIRYPESPLVEDLNFQLTLPEGIDYSTFAKGCIDGLLVITAKMKKEEPKLESFSI